jgi:hypothetical protein
MLVSNYWELMGLDAAGGSHTKKKTIPNAMAQGMGRRVNASPLDVNTAQYTWLT